MKNVHVFLGVLPTSCKEMRQSYEEALIKHFLHTGSELKDTFYAVMAVTGNEECDRVTWKIYEGIYQEPDAIDAPQLFSSEAQEQGAPAEESYEHLKESFLEDIAQLVVALASNPKWERISTLRTLGCTNLVLPASIAVNSQATPCELAPGSVCVFEYQLDPSQKEIRPASKRVIPFSV